MLGAGACAPLYGPPNPSLVAAGQKWHPIQPHRPSVLSVDCVMVDVGWWTCKGVALVRQLGGNGGDSIVVSVSSEPAREPCARTEVGCKIGESSINTGRTLGLTLLIDECGACVTPKHTPGSRCHRLWSVDAPSITGSLAT